MYILLCAYREVLSNASLLVLSTAHCAFVFMFWYLILSDNIYMLPVCLYYIILYYITLHYINSLHYIILYYIILYYIILYYYGNIVKDDIS